MNNPIVVTFGELLIDMIATNVGPLASAEGFIKKFGGAPANTAAGVAKLGAPVQFMGKVGADAFGEFLKKELDDNHVDTKHLIMAKDSNTTLAFVSLKEVGERDFSFYRGAHEAITADEVNLPDNTYLFHFGSLSQTNPTVTAATDKLIGQAKAMGAIISYDPNLRPALWPDLNQAKAIMLETIKKADIVKINEVELHFLTGEHNSAAGANKLWTDHHDAILVTQGKDGAFVKTKNQELIVPTIKVDPVDTTGAGDAFNAGFIYGIYTNKQRLSEMSETELMHVIKRANVVASLTTTKKGAISAFPTLDTAEKLI